MAWPTHSLHRANLGWDHDIQILCCIWTNKPEWDGERKDRFCEGFHTLRLPDPQPRWCQHKSVWHLCLFQLALNSVGERQDYLSTPPPPHTLKNKQNPVDMAYRTVHRVKAPNLNYHATSPSRAHLSSRPVRPLPALSLLSCSPDAWRLGNWH